MKKLIIMLLAILLQSTLVFCQPNQKDFSVLKGPYLGQTPPGKKPVLFAPGIISTPDKNEFCASFSTDGTEFYFNRGMTIMVCKFNNGEWGSPEPVSFSSGFRAHEAHISFNNKRVFWGWFKDGGYGIYYSDRVAEGWSEATSAGMEGLGMCITSDLSGQFFITRQGPGMAPVIARIVMKDGVFVDMIPIEGEINNTVGVVNSRGSKNMAHPAISPDGSYMLFDCNGGSYLWVTFRNSDGTWTEAIDLSLHGIGKEFGIATVSRDGKYLFLSGNDDIYWVSAEIIEELKNNQMP